MNQIQAMLEIRESKNKPKFTRQEYPVRKKLEEKWRKPKGIHSKMRDKKRGKRVQPSVGYCAPKLVRGLTREGLRPLLIINLNDLTKLTQANVAVISSGIGMKKRIEILKKLKEKKIKILNIKDVEKAISSLTEKLQTRKKEKQDKLKTKKEEKKKIEKEVKEEPKVSEEDKKKQEIEEKRKLLEGKQ